MTHSYDEAPLNSPKNSAILREESEASEADASSRQTIRTTHSRSGADPLRHDVREVTDDICKKNGQSAAGREDVGTDTSTSDLDSVLEAKLSQESQRDGKEAQSGDDEDGQNENDEEDDCDTSSSDAEEGEEKQEQPTASVTLKKDFARSDFATPEYHKKALGSAEPRSHEDPLSSLASYADKSPSLSTGPSRAEKERQAAATTSPILTSGDSIEPDTSNDVTTVEENAPQDNFSIDDSTIGAAQDKARECTLSLQSSQPQMSHNIMLGHPMDSIAGRNMLPVPNSRNNHAFATSSFPLQSPSFAFTPTRNVPFLDPLPAVPPTQSLFSYGSSRTAYPATTFVTRTPSQSLSIAAQQTQLIKAIGGMTNQGEEVGSM